MEIKFRPTQRIISFKVESINGVTVFGSLDNIVEDEEDPQSDILREFNSAIDSSIDTLFEKDPEVPESVLKVTSSTFSWGSEENTLMVDALNFPRGKHKYNSLVRIKIYKSFNCNKILLFRTTDDNSRENRKWQDLAVTGTLGGNSENKRKRRMDQVIITKTNFIV